MAKFAALGGFMGSDEAYDVLAYAHTYEDAMQAIEAYQRADETVVDYDFYTIEQLAEALHG
jgi:hypothetical protein